ncbi:hypothetical protein ACSBR2_023334 [Camellia fascicularis]
MASSGGWRRSCSGTTAAINSRLEAFSFKNIGPLRFARLKRLSDSPVFLDILIFCNCFVESTMECEGDYIRGGWILLHSFNDEFLTKVSYNSTEAILSFAKLFNDELTLDNISRPRLVNMCKYMGINPYGTDAYLRIRNDDKMIQAEVLESLSEAELREDCRERGMLGLLSVEEMRQQLRDWLDLSLNHSVPSSLLILSRAFTVSGKLKPEEIVGATLSSLPDEVVDTVGVVALPSEDPVSEMRRKLEFLEMQEELIKIFSE